MYAIELHDTEIHNLDGGTLAGHIGRRGTIDYVYQVEMYLQDLLALPWRRAYLKAGREVKVIWVRDMATDVVMYLARTPDYTGEWALPYVGSPDARIAVGLWGREAATESEAQAWAQVQLAGAVSAILLEHGEIRAAWEMVGGSAQLVARGPLRPSSPSD